MIINFFNSLRLFLIALTFCASITVCSPSAFSKGLDKEKTHPVAMVLDKFYEAWNAHDIDEVMAYYSKTFISGDGITKAEYKKLTEKLWSNYPDIQILNRKRAFRNQDQYSTVTTVDYFIGSTKEINEDFKEKGKINALSQGSWYLKKYGKDWKIDSDDINFELTTVTYGVAKNMLDEHYVYFSAPEQVREGQDYSATLYFAADEDVSVSSIIEKELIRYEENPILPDEEYQSISGNKLERLFKANVSSYNELVSATALLYKGIVDPKLDGLLFISKRVNVLKKQEEIIPADKVSSRYADSDFKEEVE